MADFYAQVIAEFKALGMWCIVHGPEIWLAVMIWCIGAACGIVWTWIMMSIKRRNKK